MQFIFPCLLCKKVMVNGMITETERKTYAAMKSATRTEFYQAHASGHKIEKIMIIRTFEYNGEEILKDGNERFIVLRVYDNKNGTVELTLTKECRKYEEEAVLLWDVIESGLLVEKSMQVFIRSDSISDKTFNTSYQIGSNMAYTFRMKASEYEMTKRIDADTHKPLFATKIQYQDAEYCIIQLSKNSDLDEIELICS